MRRRRRILLILVPGVILLTCFFVQQKLNPLIKQMAVASVNDRASNRITNAVDRIISEGEIEYRDLIHLEYNNSGSITALTTNMQEMNRLKSQLLKSLDSELTTIEMDDIRIPFGNLLGVELLSGRGPGIPVKIAAISSSDAKFHGEFSDAGINQTIHRIFLDVSLELLILLPSGTVTDSVSTEVCVAETVLLGPVPEQFTYFNSIP